jgi:hypothetical protein
VIDPLWVCVAVRLPVTVAVTVRLLVILGKADVVDVDSAVRAAVPVSVMEAVRLAVVERVPVLEPVPVAVPVQVPV